MDKEELMKLVEDEFTAEMYWNLFDTHQDWFVRHVFVPYFLNRSINKDLKKLLQDSLTNKSDVEWTLD